MFNANIPYASEDYREQLKGYGMIQSMSRRGDYWDNSPTERVFRSEWLHRFNFQTKDETRLAVWEYITYYNSERLHSALNYQPPTEFENIHHLKKAS